MDTYFRIGKYKYPVKLVKNENDRIELYFRYNPKVIEEVKMLEGARYHGFEKRNPRKIWSIPDTQRNRFRIAYLTGKKPYEFFDKELVQANPRREILREHQIEMFRHAITRHYCILACEMGTGKTLAVIEAMEYSGHNDWIYVAPKSALWAVQLEFEKWQAQVKPKFYTYEGFKKLALTWPSGKKPPQGLVFDECHKIKTPTAQRSKAALHVANAVREEWGEQGWVIGMSGTPAPKSPADWWHLCEVACPGFLREGDITKFQKRLAIIEQRESITGGAYPHLIAWKDDSAKCDVCGKYENDFVHDLSMGGHVHIPSENEIERLYRRMKGLVHVKFKKDCLDLPEKQYRQIKLEPSKETLRLASLIKAQNYRAATALILLRELSDGFQYDSYEAEMIPCPHCDGKLVQAEAYNVEDPDDYLTDEIINTGKRVFYDEYGEYVKTEEIKIAFRDIPCTACSGTGEVPRMARTIIEVDSPKEAALSDLLDEYEEVGRVVVYAGFTGSVDKCVRVVEKAGWNYIRVDGRGWHSSLPGGPKDYLSYFQGNSFDKIAFIGQASSAGTGLNLTASPVVIYYSNDFNAESRIQSEDRIHRMGMDMNRGAMIIDLFHLSTDELIFKNLREKRRLQDLTMGELRSYAT